jgi:putative peptide zinc metalloprotease protein
MSEIINTHHPYQELIAHVPCFTMLTSQENHELGTLLVEKEYKPGQVIVQEGALVDRVYIIAKGQAEVTNQIITPNGAENELTAILRTGDTIGLNDTGFFSTTGKRTATVTATSDMLLLAIDVKDLHRFLQKNSGLQSAMYAATSKILRIKLIKESLPFVQLDYNRVLWLANQVEEKFFPKDTIIFRQGEKGDNCYLIRSGQIEIFTTNEDGSTHRLAVLRSPTLFGEATLIASAPRNATARVFEDCELLVLPHKYLSELIESEKNVAKMCMTLMLDRARPLQNAHVTIHHRVAADGEPIVILKNTENGSYYKLSEQGWFIWQQLDGKHTLQEITLALSNQFNIFAPDMVAALISKLAKAKFISDVTIRDNNTGQKTLWHRICGLLEIRYAFGDVDTKLTQAYKKGIHLFFSTPGKILLAILATLGIIAFGFSTNETIDTFKIMPNTGWLLLLMIPFTILSVALHELGHAFAAKSFGHEVHYMGVGWYWFSPVAFTDTSDMWLSTRGPRTVVNLAGIYMDVLVAGICSLLIFVIANPYIQTFLWLFSLYTYINAFRMLNPLQELDGYYVLMDLLDKPHLRQSAVMWLVKKFPKAIRQPRLFRKHSAESIYWLCCLLFLVATTLLTLFVQTFIFKIIGIQIHNPYIMLSIPILVAIISSLGIIHDIRNQADS